MNVDTYLELALVPHVEGLADLVLAEVAASGPLAVYDCLVRPALVEVGRRWEHDELTVADEHLVTALTEQVLTRMRRRFTAGPTAVVACTPDNQHRVGAVMVSDTLGLAGWNPVLLAAPTAFDDLAAHCGTHAAGLVALSVGVEAELDTVGHELERLRDVIDPRVHVLVGGGALHRRPDWRAPVRVTTCSSVGHLLDLARALLPTPSASA